MFKSLKRITYHVSDVAKAKQWYFSILNMQPIFDAPFAIIFKIGECTLTLVKRIVPITEEAVEQIETYWEVEDIESSYQILINLGAKEHTPIKEVLDIRMAKVIDPFGNIIGITGSQLDMKKCTVEKKPSETAMVVAFCRALSAKDEREEIKGSDYLAEHFLTEEGKKPLKDSASRNWGIQNLLTSPMYGYFISRTAYIDNIFKKYISENISQIVFLGAGYDTRVYRFHDLLGETKIYEVDIKTTQNKKIDILNNINIEIPKQVTFVSINFETDNLEDLLKAGLNINAKTLYIWEGVTYYLTIDTIKKTLNFINTYSPKGSIVCFDYLAEKVDSIKAAEPFQFWIGIDELKMLLSEHGFEIIEHIDSKEMQKRYLTLKDGTLAEQVLPYFCFANAIVK